ncbi:MAG TPA: zinc dependent phospholipase C family protein [Candidatus Binataceae bacterium]|nr:zinc dependent phospholipase C family protein [Candidatus Binataceae bacterium]
MRILRLTAPLFLFFFLLAAPAYAWDSTTHRLITRLAINALPASPLKTALLRNERLVEKHSVEPDFLLKERYGHAEEIRHYIDLEVFNPNPQAALSTLDPDLATERRQVGELKLQTAGTLPWTIEDTAQRLAAALRSSDCSEILGEAGYLSHYVGDASQPLHSTIHHDGYRRDRGIHARVEKAVDDSASSIAAPAAKEVQLQTITAVWPTAIDEIRTANLLVNELIEADRKARRISREGPAYDSALFEAAGPMLTLQVARAASALASIWLYEWKSAGTPSPCSTRR